MERSSAVRYTYQDLLSMPETTDRYEIIDGELFVTPVPRLNHQVAARNVLVALHRLADEHDLGLVVGPMTTRFRDDLVLEPDVIFVARERMDLGDPEGHIHGPPDLAVEVLSPSNKGYDRNLKRKHYLEQGVAELWIVDAGDRTVEAWRAGVAEPTLAVEALTWKAAGGEYRIPLDRVFAGVR